MTTHYPPFSWNRTHIFPLKVLFTRICPFLLSCFLYVFYTQGFKSRRLFPIHVKMIEVNHMRWVQLPAGTIYLHRKHVFPPVGVWGGNERAFVMDYRPAKAYGTSDQWENISLPVMPLMSLAVPGTGGQVLTWHLVLGMISAHWQLNKSMFMKVWSLFLPLVTAAHSSWPRTSRFGWFFFFF